MGLVEYKSASASSPRLPCFDDSPDETRKMSRSNSGRVPASTAAIIRLLIEGPQYRRAPTPARRYPATQMVRINTAFVLVAFNLGDPVLVSAFQHSLPRANA